MKKNLTLLYRFDIYIYIFLEEASSSWLLVSREKESLFHLSFECIIYSIMRGPLEHYFSESSTCSYPEKRNDLYPLREERKLAETRRFLFPFSFFFFFEKYPAKYLCGITRADSTDDSEFTR